MARKCSRKSAVVALIHQGDPSSSSLLRPEVPTGMMGTLSRTIYLKISLEGTQSPAQALNLLLLVQPQPWFSSVEGTGAV